MHPSCGICGRPAVAASDGPHVPCAQHSHLPGALYAALSDPDVRGRRLPLSDEVLFDAVDAWHELGEPSAAAANDNGTMELHEFLGWSEAEYEAWVVSPDLVPGGETARDAETFERRLAEAREEFRQTAARMAVWGHPARNRLLALTSITDPVRRDRALVFLVGSEQADILRGPLNVLAESAETDGPATGAV